jgi:translocation and assembly module TamB
MPLDGALDATYDGAAANARVEVRSKKATLLEATAHADARAADLLAATPAPWTGGGRVRLLSFPLASVAPLSDRAVRGTASGELVVEGLHAQAHAKLDLDVKSLQVGAMRYPRANVSASIDEDALHAAARVDQDDGFTQLQADIGARWGSALAPKLEPSRRLDVAWTAKAFRASAFLPLVDMAVTELDGKIDANVRASRDDAGKTRLSGTVGLTDGLFQLAGSGTELHAAKGRLTMTPDGVVRLDDFSANGVTGALHGEGTAHLDGLRLVDAKASMSIPKEQAIPLDVQGAQMGEVYGDVALAAAAAPDGRAVNVNVNVPTLHVQLPLASAHGVRELDELPNVHVGMYGNGTFSALSLDGNARDPRTRASDATRYVIAVQLGNVEIVRGTTLKVALNGKPLVTVADRTVVTGQIQLRSGTLEVQGKKFEIEKGTVTFDADPSNPLVVVTAGWTAPDGTRVFADFAGPLKTGKVTLRSEPARPKNEILALILFGSADDASQAQPSYAGGASAAAGGFATEGLSRGLDELTGLQVATKIDTSNAASPRPEVEVQIARSISLQIAFVLGTPPPGSNPDKTFATIDWRFSRQWSLETTFGDEGSSFADVVWQLRY